jgi:serine/threonine protein kinase
MGILMPAPVTSEEFLALIEKSGVLEPERLQAQLDQLRTATATLPAEPKELASLLVNQGALTYFQAEQLLQGKWRGFTVGKYQILERLGAGGMGVVYLGEHKLLRRRVAIKVLPVTLAQDPWFLESFYREAQAVAALDHINIVHAHDVDCDGHLHFLVMEYVDGSNLQAIVSKHGPMEALRVAHYIRQAALGLQHAHEIGLVHRDIKPGNILLDRTGTIKILDMGLACFSRSGQGHTSMVQDDARRIVGTDDYLSPEQIVNSDDVDIRADIYSLGATAYFLLTGHPPFHDVPLDHHKLIWHLTRHPKPIRDIRPDVSEKLAAIFEKMMAKNPWQRYQGPSAVVEVLGPWTQTPIPAPPTFEMPGLSLAARRSGFPASPSSATRRGRGSWVLCNGSSDTNSNSSPISDLARSQSQTPSPSSPGAPTTVDPNKNPPPRPEKRS